MSSVNQQPFFAKYDVPAPRYTSYPTVPYWSDSPSTEEWLESLRRAYARPDMSWSMYIHVPFCETLCTFCGCNTSITRDHKHEVPYVQDLLREFDIYRSELGEDLLSRELRHVHLANRPIPVILRPCFSCYKKEVI